MPQIHILSLDADGVLSSEQQVAPDQLNGIIRTKNKEILKFATELLHQGDQLILVIGSNRQTAYSDYSNCEKEKSLLPTSLFKIIKTVVEILKEDNPRYADRVSYDTFLKTDVDKNCPAGTTFEEAQRKWEEIEVARSQNTAVEFSKEEKQTLPEPRKLGLLYAQMHYFKEKFPEDAVHVHFVDDDDTILCALHDTYQDAPDLVPVKSLTLYHYQALALVDSTNQNKIENNRQKSEGDEEIVFFTKQVDKGLREDINNVHCKLWVTETNNSISNINKIKNKKLTLLTQPFDAPKKHREIIVGTGKVDPDYGSKIRWLNALNDPEVLFFPHRFIEEIRPQKKQRNNSDLSLLPKSNRMASASPAFQHKQQNFSRGSNRQNALVLENQNGISGKKICVLSLDADGVLLFDRHLFRQKDGKDPLTLHKRNLQAFKDIIRKWNPDIIKFITTLATEYDQVVIMTGSVRQSEQLDEINNTNGTTYSAFPVYRAIVEIANETNNNVSYDEFLKENAIRADSSKQLLLYEQTHYVKDQYLKNPSDQLFYYFVDDRVDTVLPALSQYQAAPNLIPNGLTVQLYKFNCMYDRRQGPQPYGKQIVGSEDTDDLMPYDNVLQVLQRKNNIPIIAAGPSQGQFLIEPQQLKPLEQGKKNNKNNLLLFGSDLGANPMGNVPISNNALPLAQETAPAASKQPASAFPAVGSLALADAVWQGTGKSLDQFTALVAPPCGMYSTPLVVGSPIAAGLFCITALAHIAIFKAQKGRKAPIPWKEVWKLSLKEGMGALGWVIGAAIGGPFGIVACSLISGLFSAFFWTITQAIIYKAEGSLWANWADLFKLFCFTFISGALFSPILAATKLISIGLIGIYLLASLFTCLETAGIVYLYDYFSKKDITKEYITPFLNKCGCCFFSADANNKNKEIQPVQEQGKQPEQAVPILST